MHRVWMCGGALLLATTFGWGQAFDVISIKPSAPGVVGHGQSITPTEFVVRDMPMEAVLSILYLKLGMLPNDPIRNAPSWVGDERYSITAKFDEATVAAWKDLSPQQRDEIAKPLIESMLKERFKLAVHTEPAEVQGFAVIVGRHGAKLKKADMNAPVPSGAGPFQGGGSLMGTTQNGVGAEAYFHTTISSFIAEFSMSMNIPLVDQTGLTGRYDFVLPSGRQHQQ